MLANDVFQPVQERGWRHGLRNMLRVEFGKWFRTRMWWIQALIWVLVINGILAGILWGSDGMEASEAVTLFSLFIGLFPSIAIIIIMQDAVVGERESGTAAWVMSKPVSRSSFILAKLLANMAGVLVSMIVIPSLVAYIQLSFAAGDPIPPLTFIGGLGIVYINLLFYLTLTLMLGTFFTHRGPVIGVPLALAFGQQMIFGMLPFLAEILPWTLIAPGGNFEIPIAASILQGVPPYSWTPLYFTSFMTILFIGLSLWKFEQEEF